MQRSLFDRIFGDDYARGLEAECARLRGLLDAAETEADEIADLRDALRALDKSGSVLSLEIRRRDLALEQEPNESAEEAILDFARKVRA